MCVKKDLYLPKETYIYQKRPAKKSLKQDHASSLSTNEPALLVKSCALNAVCSKRPIPTKKRLAKETCVSQERRRVFYETYSLSTDVLVKSSASNVVCSNRPIYLPKETCKRDLYDTKETYDILQDVPNQYYHACTANQVLRVECSVFKQTCIATKTDLQKRPVCRKRDVRYSTRRTH